ncbi:unnamed protein product [Nezara viridula]|uniref:Choline transporter-like protein n=1 Tax=Nezara viridula TaxID=85310 RepID=A0A9P0HJ49_NEZVI|nr:unnamed protein product [Nezara viridula]
MMETIPEEEQSCTSDGKVIYLQLWAVPVALSKTTERRKSDGFNTIVIGDIEEYSNQNNIQQSIEVNHKSEILLSTSTEIKKNYGIDPKINSCNIVNEEQITDLGKTLECKSGPQDFKNSRKSTDLLWLFFFLSFAFSWLCLGVYVGATSNTTSFLSTYGSYKEECYSNDKKYLMYFGLANYFKNTVFSSLTDIYIKSKFCPTGKACVSKCPTTIWTAELFLKRILPFNYSLIQGSLICVNDRVKNNITTLHELEDIVNKNLCARDYSFNLPVLNLCLPFELMISWIANQFKLSVVINVAELFYLCVLENVMYLQILFSSSCLILIIYVFLLRWIAAPLLKISIIGFILFAIIGFIFTALGYFGIESKGSFKFYKISFIQEGSYFSLICVILAAIFLLVVIKKVFDLIRLKNYIKPALMLITETCNILLQIKGSLFFIFIIIHAYLALVIWAWNIVISLMSDSNLDCKIHNQYNLPCNCTGEYQNAIEGNKCHPENFTQFCSNCICYKPSVIKFYFVMVLRIFNVLAVIWTIMFIYAFSKMMLAYSLYTWYNNADKKELPPSLVISSTKTILKYHMGTAAYGSFGILQTVIHKIIVVIRLCPKFKHICPFNINLPAPVDKYSLIISAVNGTGLKNSTEKINSKIIEDGGRKRLNKTTQKILNIMKWTICLTLIIFLFLIPHEETFCLEIALWLLCFCIYLISTVYIQVCKIVADSLVYCYIQDQNSKSKMKKMIPESLKSFFENQESFSCENHQDQDSSGNGIHR